MRKKNPEIIRLRPGRSLRHPLEELEDRLESQLICLPIDLDDDHCLYYLCTTRCSGTKCPVFSASNTIVDMGGQEHA
jgi:hypothetical protein